VRRALDDRSPGHSLDPAVGQEVGGHFVADIRSVRIHADDAAAALAADLRAEAFTRGDDIYFGAGRYAPDTTDGRRLLRHELTHVLQQRRQEVSAYAGQIVPIDHVTEREAVSGRPLPAPSPAEVACSRASVQRQVLMPDAQGKQWWDDYERGRRVGLGVASALPGDLLYPSIAYRLGYAAGEKEKPDAFSNQVGAALRNYSYVPPAKSRGEPRTSGPVERAANFYLGALGGGVVGTVENIPTVQSLLMGGRALEAAATTPGGLWKRVKAGYSAAYGPLVKKAVDAYESGGGGGGGVANAAYELSPIPSIPEHLTRAEEAFEKEEGFEFGRNVVGAERATADTIDIAHSLTSGINPGDLLRDTEGRIGVKPPPRTTLSPAAQAFRQSLTETSRANPLVVRDLDPAVMLEARGVFELEDVASALNYKGTIASYKALSEATRGLNGAYQAHHLVEQQVLKELAFRSAEKGTLPIDYDKLESPAVVLTREQHQFITDELAERLPPGELGAMSAAEMYEAYAFVYRGHPAWLAEVKNYFPRGAR